MKRRLVAIPFAGVLFAASAFGQGNFRDLDFESANVTFEVGNLIATTNALPGWSAFSNATELYSIRYNEPAFLPSVGLYGSNFLAVSGSFSVLLSDKGSISQTALIPLDTRALLFTLRAGGLSPVVSLGGQALSFEPIAAGANYTRFGADVSSFSGQTTTLVFTAPNSLGSVIDDIQFSPQPIPEPSFSSVLIKFDWSVFRCAQISLATFHVRMCLGILGLAEQRLL